MRERIVVINGIERQLLAMSLDSFAGQLAGADPQLQQFLQAETQKQRFQVFDGLHVQVANAVYN